MNRTRKTTITIAVGLLLALALTQTVVATEDKRPPVAQVVAKMQRLYNRIKDLKGKFKQVYTDTLYNRRRTSFGYLFVKKPGMMRWNYASPEKKAFISDGKVVWIWEPADKQAFRNPLDSSSLSSGLTFLLGSGDLSQEFDISYATDAKDRLGSPQHLVLKLVPKTPTPQYDYLLFAVRPSDYAVSESMLVSRNSTNHILFSKLVFNSGIDKRRFRFKPGPDTRVIDTSALRK